MLGHDESVIFEDYINSQAFRFFDVDTFYFSDFYPGIFIFG